METQFLSKIADVFCSPKNLLFVDSIAFRQDDIATHTKLLVLSQMRVLALQLAQAEALHQHLHEYHSKPAPATRMPNPV